MVHFDSSTARYCMLAAALLACGGRGPTTPIAEREDTRDTPAVYALESVAGVPLPATLHSNQHVTLVALADTFRLAVGGAGSQISVIRVDDGLLRSEQLLAYRQSGDRIEMELECRDVLIRSCIAPPHYTGTRTPDRLLLTSVLYDRAPLLYRRVHRP
jgi:hypothetical protein